VTTAHTIQFWSIITGLVIPILVDLFSRRSWPSGVKKVMNLAFSAVSLFIGNYVVALQENAPFDWVMAFLTSLESFLIGVCAYLGIWKGTKASEAAKDTLIRD